MEASRDVPVRIDGSFAALHVLMSPGYWSETPFETKNLPKDKAGASIRTWRMRKQGTYHKLKGWWQGD